MNIEEETRRIEAEQRESQKAGFQVFMEQPTTRALMSIIPDTGHPDLLDALLRGAFEAGHSCGRGSLLATIFRKLGPTQER